MVNKTAVLIRSYLRKSLAQVIALIILFAVSALLLNTFLYIQTDYSKNFGRLCSKLETEDISLVYYNLINVNQEEQVKKSLDSLDCVADYEIDESISGPGSTEFKNGELDGFYSIISHSQVREKKIGKYEILNDIDSEGVILSYLYKVSGGYKVGDKIRFRVNENNYEYN